MNRIAVEEVKLTYHNLEYTRFEGHVYYNLSAFNGVIKADTRSSDYG